MVISAPGGGLKKAPPSSKVGLGEQRPPSASSCVPRTFPKPGREGEGVLHCVGMDLILSIGKGASYWPTCLLPVAFLSGSFYVFRDG